MEKAELEELKDKVPCAAVLEQAGFALDVNESTRKAMKFRRDAAIIIVIHDGRGWFDPLSDGKGDVFRLVEHLEGVPFVDAMNEVAGLVGFAPAALRNLMDSSSKDLTRSPSTISMSPKPALSARRPMRSASFVSACLS